MEHIVNFGISFDDATLVKRLEENAYKDIIDKIKEPIETKVNSELTRTSYSYNDPIKTFISSAIKEVVENNSDFIIQKVIEVVAEKTLRSKQFKEARAILLEDVKRNGGKDD